MEQTCTLTLPLTMRGKIRGYLRIDPRTGGIRIEGQEDRLFHRPADLAQAFRAAGLDAEEAGQVEVAAVKALDDARRQAESDDPTLVAAVHQDHTNVWWVADVTFRATGRRVPYMADEGGTLPNYRLAKMEADGIVARHPGRPVVWA